MEDMSRSSLSDPKLVVDFEYEDELIPGGGRF